LYWEGTVQGRAETVRPSWDSREAALSESCGDGGGGGTAVEPRGGARRAGVAIMMAMVQAEKSARTWFRIGL